eukprot:gnl/Spiro4/3319_TR1615_c0_g1_i1.p1 gnl/Spiro4/3319_TR1615_c0_g1~~gnl/Spiro4/3319_TR1615_c0_g1_i1.p1  ORF type:complete len:208 (-),score=23.31 gnl/Spiro4/3319_TR1615_c0_g1_i1:101-724(-)
MVSILPELVVFDLDMCLWSPEMWTLREIPGSANRICGPLDSGHGCVAVRSGNDVVRLFPGALAVLQDICKGRYDASMRIAAASSADTPHASAIARATMDLLEIVPGVTMRQVFARGWPSDFNGNIQIGRHPPLSANKGRSHFPQLRQHTGVPYDKMVFFDDCNWDDNCTSVEHHCPGVTTQRTPNGLQVHEWQAALAAYEARKRSSS